MNRRLGGYLVLQRLSETDWRVLGKVARVPGLPARRSRSQAVSDIVGHEAAEGETYCVIPLSEWRVGLDHS